MRRNWILVTLVVLGVLTPAAILYLRRPAPPPSTPAVAADWRRAAGEQRRRGHFEESARVLREAYAATKDPQAWRMLLGVLEDIGDARALVAEARDFLKAWPGDPEGQWILARGLLFAAATPPPDPQAPAWIDEAEALAGRLERAGFRPQEAPGGVVALRMQVAFLRHEWTKADRLAVETLKLGSTSGETADIVSLRFDLALRAGHLADAEALLDQALALVESWEQPSYYQLRTFREEALIVREAFFDKPFTAADLDRLAALHRELREKGFVDPTLPEDDEASRTQEVMRQWVAMRLGGDRAGQLRMLQAQLAAAPAHQPRCFYSEAVASPFRPVYLNFLAGRVCLDLGRRDEARRHFQAALEAHPDNLLITQELQKLQ